LIPDKSLDPTWQDSIFHQREELARMLREPLTLLASKCILAWGDRVQLNAVLQRGFSGIPYCCYLYVTGNSGVQISDNVIDTGTCPGTFNVIAPNTPI
jgi:hypothetical protein